jgi:hypothetical protein
LETTGLALEERKEAKRRTADGLQLGEDGFIERKMSVGSQQASGIQQDGMKPFGARVIQRFPDAIDDGKGGLLREHAMPFALGQNRDFEKDRRTRMACFR